MKWQTIDTAPKDATIIMIACPGAANMAVAWWDKHDNAWCTASHLQNRTADGNDRMRYCHSGWNPTHWCSLPEGPSN